MTRTVLTAIAMCAVACAQFKDITAAAGIKFTHNSGRAGKKWLPETMGSGCAFLDVDGDGWADILLLNSKNWTPKPVRSLSALYRNNGNGTFTDITRGSGLDVEMYAMGVAVADYDNDGREDVYITALEGDRLFHNDGGGKFRDVTKASGIANAAFATSAAFLDYDKDGLADLAVANYVQWSAKGDLWCSMDGSTKSYCTPESYKGNSSKLYRNLGGGKFADVTKAAGLGDANSKTLGIATFDANGDGWIDLFLANDTQPNKLYRNNKNGTFTEEAVASGVAFGEDGVARGAMGVDAADYDRSGRAHLLVGNFSNQMLGLYRNEGTGLFVDEAPRSTVGRASLLSLAFGVFFFDYDLDGMLDIFAANGHIDEEIGRVQPKVQYKQSPLLFRNLGQSKFADVTRQMGADFQRPIVARGAAYADIDHDGDLDVLITTNHGSAYLFRNDIAAKNHWIA
ncbi:MAG: VCBS repeat-containing protein, partial [Acidobacteria bacterium]|nr:VCBS repeat-containing protein [Acidobacteriota bacterium]